MCTRRLPHGALTPRSPPPPLQRGGGNARALLGGRAGLSASLGSSWHHAANAEAFSPGVVLLAHPSVRPRRSLQPQRPSRTPPPLSAPRPSAPPPPPPVAPRAPHLPLPFPPVVPSFLLQPRPVPTTPHLETGKGANGRKRINGYAKIRRLGQGSYAKVVLYRHEGKNEDFAVKVVSRSALSRRNVGSGSTALANQLREVEILKQLDHPNIVRLEEARVRGGGGRERDGRTTRPRTSRRCGVNAPPRQGLTHAPPAVVRSRI